VSAELAHRRTTARVDRRAAGPLVAVLCTSARAHAAAAAIALALARTTGAGCGLAAAVGLGGGVSIGALPAACRAADRLRERGLPATASGRLVWLADRRAPLAGKDAAACAAAASVELARAAAEAGAPGALALPLVRTDALDRVLAWHDALVVVPEPAAAGALAERALASLAALGRPLGLVVPPARTAAALAVAGVRAPAEALHATAALGLGAGAARG